MAYSTQARIESIFGTTAISKFSDLDNDGNAAAKTARVAVAIAVAYEEVHSFLRNTHYLLPAANAAGTAPQTLIEVEATLAGVWLYEAMGTHDIDPETGKGWHRYEYRKAWAYQVLQDIVSGVRKLDAL